MEKRYETRSGDLFVRSWARVRCVSLDILRSYWKHVISSIRCFMINPADRRHDDTLGCSQHSCRSHLEFGNNCSDFVCSN